VHRAPPPEILRAWIAHLVEQLGLQIEIDIDDLLDLSGVAAHTVARPAAPLTTFVLGYAAAVSGQDVHALGERVRELARAFADEASG
jgi:hypothetical protein